MSGDEGRLGFAVVNALGTEAIMEGGIWDEAVKGGGGDGRGGGYDDGMRRVRGRHTKRKRVPFPRTDRLHGYTELHSERQKIEQARKKEEERLKKQGKADTSVYAEFQRRNSKSPQRRESALEEFSSALAQMTIIRWGWGSSSSTSS